MKFNQNYYYIHNPFIFYCLCLHLFHGQYLPTAHHLPVYTEYNFAFPTIDINARAMGRKHVLGLSSQMLYMKKKKKN